MEQVCRKTRRRSRKQTALPVGKTASKIGGGGLLASLFLIAAVAIPTRTAASAAKRVDIRDDYLDPCVAAEAGFLSKIVYQLDGVFDIVNADDVMEQEVDAESADSTASPEDYFRSNLTTGADGYKSHYHYSDLSWMDVGSTEVLVARKTGGTIDGGGIPPDSAVVTFRGSEEIDDWIVNVDQFKVPFGPENRTIDYPMYQLSDDDSTFGEQPILVHRGFNGVFLLYDDILERLEDLGLNDTAPLYVNGHSLGGANAQLFAAYYAFAHPQRSVYLTTFGQPRVGSKGFKLFAERLRNLNVWRIVLEDDIITRIPYSEYVHTGHLLWKSYRQEFVQSFYRQIGSSLKNLKGVLDFSLAVLKGLESDPDSVQDLILDHFMSGYLEWMESACRGDASNFTTDFERLA